MRTINYDGSVSEVEVSHEVWKVDKEFKSNEKYQSYKKRKHFNIRKFEISLENILKGQNQQKFEKMH
jgi:hypothetical protein